jgi:superfamily II RNA helicase
VSAPTGAGKTLVAEVAIADAVAAGRRCIYTAPIKALSNQKYRDFRDDPEIDVGLMTGDVTLDGGAQVLVMTTEILRNAMFESPRTLDDVEFVIFDEVHFMDDHERGTVWEESLIFAPPSVRFICLSATISNLTELGEWIGEIRPRPIEIVSSTHRPVPLEFRLFTADSGAFEPRRIERVRKREAAAERSAGARGGRRRGRGGRGGRGGGRGRGGRGPRDLADRLPPDPAPLFDDLEAQGLLPALVFSFSRKECERLARANLHRDLLDAAGRERMDALQAELIELFELGEGAEVGEVFSMARRGVGVHHAGMLPVHKELVERMFTSGLLRMLFTTETFALGINMPARTVVFRSLEKFDGRDFDYMRTRDFLQMAGRAGRQGIDDAGLVYSMLSKKDLREAPVARLHDGRPEPVESRFRLSYSSLLHLVERLGRERLHEAWEKSFNAFQHRGSSQRERDKNRRRQARRLDAHLAFLEDLGYLEGSRVRARGRLARHINGFELPLTELLYDGALEDLPPRSLATVFCGLIHEERRRGEPVYVPARLEGRVRRRVDGVVRALAGRATRFPGTTPIRLCQWGLTGAVLDWTDGRPFDELEPASDVSPGDLCRTLRMAVQLMRQARRAIDPAWDLAGRLDEAVEAVARDEVDARRQLELG